MDEKQHPVYGLERLHCTFSTMGPSTELSAKGMAMALGMRSASQGCFSKSIDVGPSWDFCMSNPQCDMLDIKESVCTFLGCAIKAGHKYGVSSD